MTQVPTTVVFDLGGVLVDWNPRYLYRKLLASDAEIERFLADVTTPKWNLEQDRGRSWTEAVEKLTAQFPEHAELIAAYDTRWEEMIGGPIEGTVDILRELKDDRGVGLYALTNWSEEKFDLTYPRFEWLSWFSGIVVSGTERLVKPDPRIFHVLFDRYGIDPSSAVYIDDNEANVNASRALGMVGLHFTDPATLRTELTQIFR
ncbi:HAD family hydrolase [Phytoactinopolyspora endophytica]|uniref:HAD family hydrolase n=1 Tax=Phytoactinopolyspora endophytica TaxID=1642495 RepID=UPI00101DF814|nr:HAD family phosphatase [Phytoactinopolyspora endophytica]